MSGASGNWLKGESVARDQPPESPVAGGKNPESFGHPASAQQMLVCELSGAERRAKTCAEQAKSIADELMTGCTNFVFSGKPGTGKNHLAAAIGNHLLAKGRSVIVITVADVMLALHNSYDNKTQAKNFYRGCVMLTCLSLDEIGMQRDTRNEAGHTEPDSRPQNCFDA